MRFVTRLGVLVCAVVMAAEGTAGGAVRAQDSGIVARVLYGPTCPVQRPGISCVRPYRAWVMVRRLPAEVIVARGRSTAAGRLRLGLRPGRYLIQPRNGRPYPHAATQTVSVRAHRFTPVTIRFDSGIR